MLTFVSDVAFVMSFFTESSQPMLLSLRGWSLLDASAFAYTPQLACGKVVFLLHFIGVCFFALVEFLHLLCELEHRFDEHTHIQIVLLFLLVQGFQDGNVHLLHDRSGLVCWFVHAPIFCPARRK